MIAISNHQNNSQLIVSSSSLVIIPAMDNDMPTKRSFFITDDLRLFAYLYLICADFASVKIGSIDEKRGATMVV